LSSTGYEGVESHGASVRISFRLDGRKIRERLENVPDTPQGWKQAAGIRKKIIQRIEAGAYRRADFFSDARRETQKTAAIFDDFAPLWIAERTLHVKPATIKAYKHIVARFSKKFGKRRMLDIDYLDIAQFLADLKVSAKTRNNYRISYAVFLVLLSIVDTSTQTQPQDSKTRKQSDPKSSRSQLTSETEFLDTCRSITRRPSITISFLLSVLVSGHQK